MIKLCKAMERDLETQTREVTKGLRKRRKQEIYMYLYRLLGFQSLLKASGQTDQRERGPAMICPLRSALIGRSAVARGTFAREP